MIISLPDLARSSVEVKTAKTCLPPRPAGQIQGANNVIELFGDID